jgi:hypothetical protein
MKKFFILLAVAITAIAYAAQDSSLSIRQVRDPVQLKAKLNANFADAESRIAELEVTIGTNVNGAVSVASLTASGAVMGGSLSTTGDVGIAEGALTDSTVVTADIKDGEIVDADINASAAIDVTKLGTGGVIPVNSAASLTNIPAANLTGDIALARMASAVPAFASGSFYVSDTTQLVFIAGSVTNVIDADITTP